MRISFKKFKQNRVPRKPTVHPKLSPEERKKRNAERIIRARENRLKNNRKRRAMIKYHKVYNEANKEKIRTLKKTNYMKNRQKFIDYQKKYNKRKRDELKAFKNVLAAQSAIPINRQHLPNRPLCPVCGTPVRMQPKPELMVINGAKANIDKKFLVRMYPIGELSIRIGKMPQTLHSWFKDGIMPDAQYHTKVGRRVWTQDQIEAIMGACDHFDLRPPVSYEKIGFVREMKQRLYALAPLGLDQSKYDEQDADGFWRRKDDALPTPLTLNTKLFNNRKAKNLKIAKHNEKWNPLKESA